MFDIYSDKSYSVLARLLHVYTYSVLKTAVQTEIAKGMLSVYGYTEGGLYNLSLTFEVILCTDYVH